MMLLFKLTKKKKKRNTFQQTILEKSPFSNANAEKK